MLVLTSLVRAAAPPFCAFVLGAGALFAASNARAYNGQIAIEAGSGVYLPSSTLPADSRNFLQQTYSTNLPAPLNASRDASVSAGVVGGNYLATNSSYSGWLEPGGLHLSARSAVLIDYVAAADGNRALHAIDNGNVSLSLDDRITFSIAGRPVGTPFLMEASVRVDALAGSFSGAPGTPVTPNAYASGNTSFGFDLLVDGARPAGLPSAITNRFSDSGYFGVRPDGTTFNDLARFNYPKLVTVTMYAYSGMPLTVEMFARMGTGAIADASYNPESAGSVEAGVWGNMANTLSWQGVSGMRLVDGTPIPTATFSAISSSGFDYTKAYVASIPEPSSAWLMVLGLLPLWQRWRRPGPQRVKSQNCPLRLHRCHDQGSGANEPLNRWRLFSQLRPRSTPIA
jgi:hypothetical protein